jgi:outer membrane protein assembly factor BamB
MTHAVATPSVDSSARCPRRLWFVGAVLATLLAAIAVVWLVLPESFDHGTRLLLSFVSVVVASIALLAWFLSMGGFARRTRWAGLLTLIAAAVFVAASIRRVEFSGDMEPSFDLRWSPDRATVLESHRARQRSSRENSTPEVTTRRSELVEIQPGRDDVLEYRGAKRDGIVDGPRLARDWATEPPRLVWRQPVGGGYASFVVAGPLAITIEQRGDREAVVAYDVDDGNERWLYAYPALFSEVLGGDGPRATPTIHDGQVYSLGATGVLACLELTTGRELWSVNILERNGSGNIEWGMSGSPLIYDQLVLVNPGSQKGSATSHAIAAFDAADGKSLWAGGAAKASYASPMLASFGGVRQVVIFDAVGLAGFAADDGRELWRVPWKSDFEINAAQPVLLSDDKVLISSSAGAALLRISHSDENWEPTEIWKNRKLKCGYACPIAYQGHVYGLSEGILTCLDLATGRQLWKDRGGQYGHGQMLLSGDLLIVQAETGELALVEATPERFHELGRFQAIEGKTWNNPTLVGRRIFVRNHLEMAAYDLPLAP